MFFKTSHIQKMAHILREMKRPPAEEGTDELVDQYKNDTPGQGEEVEEHCGVCGEQGIEEVEIDEATGNEIKKYMKSKWGISVKASKVGTGKFMRAMGDIPNEFRAYVIKKFIPTAKIMNKNDINYGNIRNTDVALHVKQWDELINEEVEIDEAKMGSSDTQDMYALMVKGLKAMPGSPKQKEIIKQINVIRKRMGMPLMKEEIELDEMKWAVGGVYHQEFKNGDKVYFRADSIQKNKRWKGMSVDEFGGRQKKAKNASADEKQQGWVTTPKNEIPKGLKEEVEIDEASRTDTKKSGKLIAKRMRTIRSMKPFASKVAKMKTVSVIDLERMLPADKVSISNIDNVMQDWGWPDDMMEEVELNEFYTVFAVRHKEKDGKRYVIPFKTQQKADKKAK